MGSCVCGLFTKAGRKGPTLVRFHFIKKKKKSEECWDFIVLMVMDG